MEVLNQCSSDACHGMLRCCILAAALLLHLVNICWVRFVRSVSCPPRSCMTLRANMSRPPPHEIAVVYIHIHMKVTSGTCRPLCDLGAPARRAAGPGCCATSAKRRETMTGCSCRIASGGHQQSRGMQMIAALDHTHGQLCNAMVTSLAEEGPPFWRGGRCKIGRGID